MEPTWIAELAVVFQHPDGTRNPGRIALAAPTPWKEHFECRISLSGMERSPSIQGNDSLQALLLASGFLSMRLHDFLDRGGRVLFPPTEERHDVDVPLESYFGSYLKDPAPVQPLEEKYAYDPTRR